MIVLDASCAVALLLRLRGGDAVAARLRSESDAHVPHLLTAEVAQVARRYALRGEVAADVAAEALIDLAEFPFERHAHDHLLPRVWQLRDHLTAYDAIYVALAELLDAPLVTLDAALARSPGHDAVIELVS